MHACVRKGDSTLTSDNRVLEVVYTRTSGVVAVRETRHTHVRLMGQSEWVSLCVAFHHRATTAVGGIGPFENLHYDEASDCVLLLHRTAASCRWVCASEWMDLVVNMRRAHAPVRGARLTPRDAHPPTVCVYQTNDVQLWMDTCTLGLVWVAGADDASAGETGASCML